MKSTLLILLVSLTVNQIFSQSVNLPEPQKTGGMPLMEALSKRSTARAFDTTAISMQQLSNLLWAAFGVNRANGKRTAPSARNFQETDIYVLLKQGAYVYDAPNNKLNLISNEDARDMGATQPFAKEAPLMLILVADLAKIKGGEEDEKQNTANIDAGYISQNIYLYCASEGLVTGARGSVDRNTLGPKLNLRTDQLIIIAHSIGYSRPEK